MNESQKQQVAQALEEAKETGSFNLRAICQTLGLRPIDVINYWKELGCMAMPVDEPDWTAEVNQGSASEEQTLASDQAKYACILKIIVALNGQTIHNALDALNEVADIIKMWHLVDIRSEFFQTRSGEFAEKLGLQLKMVEGT